MADLSCLGLYLLFMAVSAAIALALATVVHLAELPLLVVPAYAIAWLIGFVVPGASGGLGVREVVFLLLTETALGGGGALAVALAMRVVTTLGDLLFFFASFAFALPATGGASALADVQDEGG